MNRDSHPLCQPRAALPSEDKFLPIFSRQIGEHVNLNEQNSMAAVRSRLYESYATTHAGRSGAGAAVYVYRRDIRPHLPGGRPARVLDIGCGQGKLVRLLREDGHDASGVDVSPEQVALAHEAGVAAVVLGDFIHVLAARRGDLDAVVATDLLEHLTKDEVLQVFDSVRGALRPSGVFIARTPNAISPFSGGLQYGDFTHESVFTPRSVTQIASATGYVSVQVRPCPPVVHGVQSRARAVIWKAFSGVMKLAIAAETGQRHDQIVTQNMTFVAQTGGESPVVELSIPCAVTSTPQDGSPVNG